MTPWTVAQKLRLLCTWGFSRQEYWSGLLCPPPGNLPDSGIKPVSLVPPARAGGFFTTNTPWEVQSASRITIICSFSNTRFYVRGLTDTAEVQRGKVIVPGSHSKKMAKQIRCLFCSSESPVFSLCVQPDGQAHPTPSLGPAGHGQCSLGHFPAPPPLVRQPRDYLLPPLQCLPWGGVQAPIHRTLQVSNGLISRSNEHSTLPLPVSRGSEQAMVRLGALTGKDCVFSA